MDTLAEQRAAAAAPPRWTLRELFGVIFCLAVIAAVAQWEGSREFFRGYNFTPLVIVVVATVLLFRWLPSFRWLAVLAGIGVGGFLSLPALDAGGRMSARMLVSQSNLKQIGLAIADYEFAKGAYPPAYIAAADGKPLHSWRVLILPYLGEQALYDEYNFDEPWDSPANLKVAQRMPEVYRHPYDRRGTQVTPYLAVVGPETMWPGARGVQRDEIADSVSWTLCVLERPASDVIWTEPRDLSPRELEALLAAADDPALRRRRHPDTRIPFVHPDGSTSIATPRETPLARWQALITRAGGEHVEE